MHNIIIQISNFFQTLGMPGLAINAVIESCLPGFPLPPDVLLIAMSLSSPAKAMLFALVCTAGSLTGALIGYSVGKFGGRPLFNYLFRNKIDKLNAVEKLFDEYGSFAVFFSAFSPIPYNIFAIASGILEMNVFKFLFVSALGRGGRFFFISAVLLIFGETIKQYMNYFIAGISVLLVLFFVVLYKKRHSIISADSSDITEISNKKSKEKEQTEQEICQ